MRIFSHYFFGGFEKSALILQNVSNITISAAYYYLHGYKTLFLKSNKH